MRQLSSLSLVIVSLLTSLLLCNGASYVYLDFYTKSRDWILPPEALQFYLSYENRLNHLRGPDFKNRFVHAWKDHRSLMFNRFSVTDSEEEILIAGDSWAEEFVRNKKSYTTLKSLSVASKTSITVSGTTSYSPTLIGIQSRILSSDFDLVFDKAFIVLDSTDIGDELCRYKNVTYRGQNGLLAARAFDNKDGMAVYNHSGMLRANSILLSDQASLLKLIRLAIAKFDLLLNSPDVLKCGWSEIAAYLYTGATPTERDHFISRLDLMIEELRTTNNEIEIFLITAPHRAHLEGEYVLSASDWVKYYLQSTEYLGIHMIDLSAHVMSLLNEGYEIDDLYLKDDPASHLTSLAHNEILVTLVAEEVIGSQRK